MQIPMSLRVVVFSSFLAAAIPSQGATAAFDFGPVSTIHGTGVTFTVSLAALNPGGQTNTSHSGNVALEAYSTGASSEAKQVGFSTAETGFFLFTYYHDSRSQMIFLQSELGQAGSITNLEFFMTRYPEPSILTNCTVRFKHTTLAEYPGEVPVFYTNGWHVGFRANYQPNHLNQWNSIPIDPPFVFDGAQNLLVDFSFDNETYFEDPGLVQCTTTNRIMHYHASSDSYAGDPRDWTGSEDGLITSPQGEVNWFQFRPNLRFGFLRTSESPVVVVPTVLLGSEFDQGVWQGGVTIHTVRSNVVLRATQGSITGLSAVFHVLARIPMAAEWLAQFNLPPDADPNGNPDNDPFITYDEFIADTNPTNGLSYLQVTGYVPGPPTVIDFAPASTGRLYTLQFVDKMTAGIWSNVPGVGPRAGVSIDDSMTDTNAVPTRFHRIQVALP